MEDYIRKLLGPSKKDTEVSDRVVSILSQVFKKDVASTKTKIVLHPYQMFLDDEPTESTGEYT